MARWTFAGGLLIAACGTDAASSPPGSEVDGGDPAAVDAQAMPDADPTTDAASTADVVADAAPEACVVPAAVAFSDADFNVADWTLTKFGDGTAMEESFALGNPTPSMKVTISCNTPAPGNRTTVTAVLIKNAATYAPMVAGPIASIDYKEEYLNGSANNGPLSGAALEQGGVLFRQMPGQPLAQLAWAPLATKNLRATDFQQVDGVAHPDFSASGAPIQFGFFRQNTTPGIGCCPITVAAYADNWSVTVNSGACSPNDP